MGEWYILSTDVKDGLSWFIYAQLLCKNQKTHWGEFRSEVKPFHCSKRWIQSTPPNQVVRTFALNSVQVKQRDSTPLGLWNWSDCSLKSYRAETRFITNLWLFFFKYRREKTTLSILLNSVSHIPASSAATALTVAPLHRQGWVSQMCHAKYHKLFTTKLVSSGLNWCF